MRKRISGLLLAFILAFIASCGRGGSNLTSGTTQDQGTTPPTGNTQQTANVLMWKGDLSGSGLYANEKVLTPANVTSASFGKLAEHPVDGMILAQPLFVSALNMAGSGTHDVVIVATEHDSVYAFDVADPNGAPLWERHYAVNGATPAPDNYGGRTTIGGEIGITGTPVIDPTTNTMYFVTMLQVNGVPEQWLRAIDIRSGADAGPGSVKVQASVPGDGKGSSGGQIPFDATIHNQRAGLILTNGSLIVTWGSFSDWGVYHGWLMAYDPTTLQQKGAFTLTPQHQATDVAYGPSDFGGGGSVWQGGAIPSVDTQGNIYVVAADGSFNADQGGQNYGDSVVKLKFDGHSFQVVDWFSPSDQTCINPADLEIGSGGVALLPVNNLAAVINKEGRLYLLNTGSLGHYSAAGDTQIPQQFMVGANTCFAGVGPDHAEGTDWNRLYGNPSFWNGNLYVAPANGTLRQYKLSNGMLSTTPTAQSPTATGMRGGNTVVSASGNQNAIVWMYEKSATGHAILHAYDATNIAQELWNSDMKGGDGMGVGIGFGTPVVAGGRVLVTYNKSLVVYGPH